MPPVTLDIQIKSVVFQVVQNGRYFMFSVQYKVQRLIVISSIYVKLILLNTVTDILHIYF